MDNRPIGVFDSGLGGLTAVKELEEILPGESIVYFGDTGRVPYGTRSRDTVRRYAGQDMLAACGTVSSTAKDIGERLPVRYFDVVDPTARAALRLSHSKKIGITGTSATIHSGAYVKAILALDPQAQVYPKACPLFVPLVESGFVDPQDEITRLTVERYLAPLRDAGVDVLILGCTHYPIIKEAIGRFMGPEVALVDSGREAALALGGFLRENHMLCSQDNRRTAEYYVTDEPENFEASARLFLGHSVEGKRIDIEKYSSLI